MGEEKLKKLYTILLVLLLPLAAQDSTKVKIRKHRAKIVKKAKMKKAVTFMVVGGVSYYAGYVHGKHERKRRYGRRWIGDKDYPGK